MDDCRVKGKSLGLMACDSPHEGKWDLGLTTNNLSISRCLFPGFSLDQNLSFTVKINHNIITLDTHKKFALRTIYQRVRLFLQQHHFAPKFQKKHRISKTFYFHNIPLINCMKSVQLPGQRKNISRLNIWTGKCLQKMWIVERLISSEGPQAQVNARLSWWSLVILVLPYDGYQLNRCGIALMNSGDVKTNFPRSK